MNDLIPINYDSERPTVSARELHAFLEIDTPYLSGFRECANMAFRKRRILPRTILYTPKISNQLQITGFPFRWPRKSA